MDNDLLLLVVAGVAVHLPIIFLVSRLIAAVGDGADKGEKIDYLSSIDAAFLVHSISEAP